MKSVHIIVLIVLALITVAALSGVLLGVEDPIVEFVTESSGQQSSVSECLDRNPEYSYEECLEEVG